MKKSELRKLIKEVIKENLEQGYTLDELTIDDCKIILKYPIKINKDIQVMLGPYGTYIKYLKKNYKIRQNIEYTEEYCLSIINK